VHLGKVEGEALDEGEPPGAGEAHAQGLGGAGAEDAGRGGQERPHLAPRDRSPRVERADAEGGPLGLVHQVPAGDRGLAAVALGDRGEDALEEAGAAVGIADVVPATAQANAVHRAGRVEPEEVDEDELGAQARLPEPLDGRVHVREEAFVEAGDAPVPVLGHARPPVAEEPPPHQRGAAPGQLAEGSSKALATLGSGEAAPGLPRVRSEVQTVVEPGQVRPDHELTHSA
jgi:hypothetical protein